MLGKIGKAVQKAAPVLLGIAGTAGGPLGTAATRAVATALGLGEDAQDHEIEQELARASPEQLVRLRTADKQYQLDMRSLDLEELGIHAGDRDSARQREIALRDGTPRVMAYTVLFGFFGVIALLGFVKLPEGAEDVMYVLVGILGSMVNSLKDYYWGSSRQDSVRSAEMADALREAGRSRALRARVEE